MKTWLKVLGAVFVLLVAAAASVVALVMQYDYNALKPTIQTLAKDATGRDLVIDGNLDLAISLQPTLSVTDVAFANAPWVQGGAEGHDMVKLNRLDAKIDLMALLRGQVNIDYIVLDGLKVALETDGEGRANWEFEAPGQAPSKAQSGELALTPNVRDVRLHDVDVTYRDGATGKTLHLLLTQANFKADGFEAPMRATLAAQFQGVDVNASVELGSFKQLVSRGTEPFPVNMEISAPGVLATVTGTVDQPQAGLGVNAHADLRVSDSDTLSTLAGAELPNLDGLIAKLSLSGDGTRYKVAGLDARVGDTDVTGNVVIDLAGARPKLSGKVTSKLLDLDTLLDLDAPQPTAPTEGEKLFSRDPLPFAALRSADADLSVQVSRIKVMHLTLDAVETGVKLNAGRLDVDPLKVTVEDGDVDGHLRLDGAAAAPDLLANATVRDLDAGRVLAALGYGDLAILPLSGDVKISSSGESVHSLMRNLNGEVRFVARSGRIKDSAFKGLTTGLGSVLPWAKQADGSVITCLVADWPITEGNAVARTVLMDTPGFNVAVTGNIDLGGELLHLTIIPKAKTASLASFAVPVRLKGPLSAPYVDVDPGDLVVGTVENIVKAPANILGDILGAVVSKDKSAQQANDPCLEALGGGKTAPAKPTQNGAGAVVPPPPREKPSAPQIPGAETLGKALDSLLGR